MKCSPFSTALDQENPWLNFGGKSGPKSVLKFVPQVICAHDQSCEGQEYFSPSSVFFFFVWQSACCAFFSSSAVSVSPSSCQVSFECADSFFSCASCFSTFSLFPRELLNPQIRRRRIPLHLLCAFRGAQSVVSVTFLSFSIA